MKCFCSSIEHHNLSIYMQMINIYTTIVHLICYIKKASKECFLSAFTRETWFNIACISTFPVVGTSMLMGLHLGWGTGKFFGAFGQFCWYSSEPPEKVTQNLNHFHLWRQSEKKVVRVLNEHKVTRMWVYSGNSLFSFFHDLSFVTEE